jgi:hypothetical protein
LPLLFNSDDGLSGSQIFHSANRDFGFSSIIKQKKSFYLTLSMKLSLEYSLKIFPYSEQFSWLNSETYFLPTKQPSLQEKIIRGRNILKD